MAEVHDLLVIGGGINGAGIARDAAGRGLKVLLVEQGDLASATSSASSKLAHGGLRYLETYEFRLVAEALAEREVLMAIAPHLCWPMTFVLPHDSALRPAWKIRLGLLLYDRLARRSRLPASRAIAPARDLIDNPLAPRFGRAFTYADCWLDDARLVVLNAVDAVERGADIRTRCRVIGARPAGDVWEVRLATADSREHTAAARIIVNAAGPWADKVRASLDLEPAPPRLRLVRGSHIVVPRLHEGPEAFILQNDDGRVVFLLPFEDDFTLIGTTDVEQAEPRAAAVSAKEIAYLCDAANRWLARPVTPADVVWSYAGVRALVDNRAADPAKVTREYSLDLEQHAHARLPVLSVYGGKLTTYRSLAETAVEKLRPLLSGLAPSWTARVPLPGGDLPDGGVTAFAAELQSRFAKLPAALVLRLVRTYGTRAERIAAAAVGASDAGMDIGSGITRAELSYLVDTELARTAEDVLWRRGKLGLRVSPEERAGIERALAR